MTPGAGPFLTPGAWLTGLNSRNRGIAQHFSRKYAHSPERISVLFLLAITAADVVPCGGPKKIHSADYIFFLVL